MGTRTDGLAVLQCRSCWMGFVERRPRDPSVVYGDEYFRSGDSRSGYSDHELVSAHSTRWAASLVGLLKSSGAVLDVGCANGDLLAHLGHGFGRFGIEPNPTMAARCRASGIEIIGADICDAVLTERYRSRFAVVTAVAVLEHVADIVRALRHIRAMLAPGGTLLFEVPLISQVTDSTVWFRSSLEHIHYPTTRGLQNLVLQTFGTNLVGGEVAIQDYGPTFVGLVGADAAAQAEAERLYTRLFMAPAASLVDPREVTFRFLLDVVHGARRGPEELSLLARADQAALAPEIRARLAALWKIDVERRQQIGALEEARDHFRTQAGNWEREARAAVLAREKAKASLAARAKTRRARPVSKTRKGPPGRPPTPVKR